MSSHRLQWHGSVNTHTFIHRRCDWTCRPGHMHLRPWCCCSVWSEALLCKLPKLLLWKTCSQSFWILVFWEDDVTEGHTLKCGLWTGKGRGGRPSAAAWVTHLSGRNSFVGIHIQISGVDVDFTQWHTTQHIWKGPCLFEYNNRGHMTALIRLYNLL